MILSIFTVPPSWCETALEKAPWWEQGNHSFTPKRYQFFWNLGKDCMDTQGWLLESLLILWRLQITGKVTAIFHPFWLAATAVAIPNCMYRWHCLGQCLPVSQCVPCCTVVTHASTWLSTAKSSGQTPPRFCSKSLSLWCFPQWPTASTFRSSSEYAPWEEGFLS